MKLLTVDTIEQGREKLLNHIKSLPLKTENITLNDSRINQYTPGFFLAEDVFAPCDIPSFRRSTVDGYAVAADDTAGATETVPVFLKLAGSVIMGKKAGFSIDSGSCAYVPTGGMLPEGADAVVMIEYSEAAGDMISLYEAVSGGRGTIETGEDFQKDKLLLKRGDLIRPQEIGALCAAGITNISVFAPLSLGIFSTGDELVAPENNPAPGQIRDINTNTLKALAVKFGYNVSSSCVFPDDEAKLEAALREAAALNDIVLISGGSSQGEKDFTVRIIDRIAKPGVFTHGLAVKPGKPAILGWDEEGKTLFAGLPGHPVSAMMIFTLLFKSLHADILFSGYDKNSIRGQSQFPVPARISCNVPGSPGRSVCLPVTLSLENESYLARPVFGKAGLISTLTNADGYIIIDLNKEGLKKDEHVFVYLL